MQAGSRRSSENLRQLCEPPETTLSLQPVRPRGRGLHHSLFSHQSYTTSDQNHTSLEFGHIYTTARNQDSKVVRPRLIRPTPPGMGTTLRMASEAQGNWTCFLSPALCSALSGGPSAALSFRQCLSSAASGEVMLFCRAQMMKSTRLALFLFSF